MTKGYKSLNIFFSNSSFLGSYLQFEKLQNFFETMPTLKHDVEVTNPQTNVTSIVTLTGINAFF